MRFLVHRASSSRALLYVSMYSIFYASQSSKLIASKAISAKRKRHSVSSFSDQVTSEKKTKNEQFDQKLRVRLLKIREMFQTLESGSD